MKSYDCRSGHEGQVLDVLLDSHEIRPEGVDFERSQILARWVVVAFQYIENIARSCSYAALKSFRALNGGPMTLPRLSNLTPSSLSRLTFLLAC